MADPLQVRRYLDRQDVLRLFAKRKDKAVGVASLYFDHEGWSPHVGELRCVVRSGMHGIGIATTLLRELVHISQLRGIDKLVAQIPANDSHTRKIYRMLGFRQEAVLKSHVRDWRGTVQDLVVATRHTDDLWHQMEELVSYYKPE
jgi:RimJ/RimL family protein N-acetyltransferase